MKIKTINYGLIHYHAQCSNCNWSAGIFTDEAPKPSDVRNAIHKHIRATGHKVVLEKSESTHYEPSS